MRHFDVKMAVKLRKAIKAKRGNYSQEEFASEIRAGVRTVAGWEGKSGKTNKMSMAVRCNCLCLMDENKINIEELQP